MLDKKILSYIIITNKRLRKTEEEKYEGWKFRKEKSIRSSISSLYIFTIFKYLSFKEKPKGLIKWSFVYVPAHVLIIFPVFWGISGSYNTIFIIQKPQNLLKYLHLNQM